jgi:hypothetical protein
MTSMLEKLKLKRQELASKAAAPAAPSSPTPNVSNATTASSTTPSHGNQPVHHDIANDTEQGTAAISTSDANTMKSPAKTPQKTVRFFVNSIPRKLSLDRLVWAPYYAWGTSVPARLCDNHEAKFEPTIVEIPLDQAVVEVLGQEECTDRTRLILVERSKVFPYWAKKSNDEKSSYIETEGDVPTKWNEYRVKYLRDKVNLNFRVCSRYWGFTVSLLSFVDHERTYI